MKKIKNMLILAGMVWCALLCMPVLAYADSDIQPPTGVETNYKQSAFGWPGLIPEDICVEWIPSHTEGVAGYHIYEIFTGQDGTYEYVKVGSAGADETMYRVYYGDGNEILGFHRFVVTAVMPDGRESDYSEIAESGIYLHLDVREIRADVSSVSIEWDRPGACDADCYEIWYCEDNYSYWEYYDVYYGVGISNSSIEYMKIAGIEKDMRVYAVTGLKPDTSYVFMVQAYLDGKPLDRSDFLQVKTAVPEWTQATIIHKDTNTGETVKEETIDGLKPGEAYAYQPINSFETGNKIYTFDSSNAGQTLNIERLHGNPEKNAITVYWTAKEKSVKPKRVFLYKPVRLTGRKVKVKWRKIPEVKGYQVVWANNKKFKKPKKKITAKNAYTLKNLKRGKTYYMKARAYGLDSAGKKVYGAFSGKRKVKVR